MKAALGCITKGEYSMTVSAHNPDQYMASLRQIIAQGRKRIGLLVGAGAPAGIFPPGSDKPLIPAVAGITDMVMEALKADYGNTLDAVRAELESPNIETILSRARSLAGVIGKTKVHDLDGEGYKKLSQAICEQIGIIVNKPLYDGPSPYTEFVTWISGTGREHPVEIFTTNYDLLFEQALERARVPFFDGFSGANEPFFDPSSVASNDLPARWTRLWKLQFPAALPAMFTGFRISAGLSVIGAIVAEFFFGTGPKGLGRLISDYTQQNSTAKVMAAITFTAALGIALFLLFGWLSRRLTRHWRAADTFAR